MGGRWGSHSRSWGSTAAESARPCRRRPCRLPRTRQKDGTGSSLSTEEQQQQQPAAGRRGRVRSSSAGDGSLEGGGAPRRSPPPFRAASGPGWARGARRSCGHLTKAFHCFGDTSLCRLFIYAFVYFSHNKRLLIPTSVAGLRHKVSLFDHFHGPRLGRVRQLKQMRRYYIGLIRSK